MIDFPASPRPWRLVENKPYAEIQDAEGNLICGVWQGVGMQGGLIDRGNAQLLILAVNIMEAP